MKKIGVLLSGCGVYDGSEIHEAVLTLLAIDRHGAQAVCLAPNIPQVHVVDHLQGAPAEGEQRNVLVESARIARGEIRDLAAVTAAELDGLVLPGGFGAAKNLCDFAFTGARCQVQPEVARLVRELYRSGKPIAAVCIAPVVLARILGEDQIAAELTIGSDPGTAGKIREMGGVHRDCPVQGFIVDRRHRLVTTPAYMLARRVSEVADGIDGAVDALLGLME